MLAEFAKNFYLKLGLSCNYKTFKMRDENIEGVFFLPNVNFRICMTKHLSKSAKDGLWYDMVAYLFSLAL